MNEIAALEPESDSPGEATIRELLRYGRKRLAARRNEGAALDAEVLLRHALGLDRTQLLSRLSEPAANDAIRRFEALLDARLRGVPIAYLVGEKEFMGLSFVVSPAVLVPRPETEILVEWALAWLADRDSATVIDVGTGSGAIALSIAAMLGPDWRGRILASDISADALAIAAENRERLGQTTRVELVEGPLLEWRDLPVDLVLANLPYLRPNQIESNPDLTAEPLIALDGGNEGLDLVAALLHDLPRVLRPSGAAGLEIDPSQSGAVAALAQAVFSDADVTVLKDLAGHDRHVIIRTGESCGQD